MNQFQVGFSRMIITLPLGVGLAGYFEERPADAVRDELEANCIAVCDGETTAVIMSCDLIYGDQLQMDINRKAISEATGIPYEGIYIACTHTHTGPYVRKTTSMYDAAYLEMLARKLSDAAVLAIADLAPATAEAGRNTLKDIAFVRRFVMKDGSIRTNPGIGNPDVDHPIGTPDETVQVLRFKRDGKDDVVVVNFQVHPDTVGGCGISADFPRFVRETLETTLSGIKCVYFNGAQGDTNHFNVRRNADFYIKMAQGDPRNYAKHMGRSIAGSVLQVWGILEPIALGAIRFGQTNVDVPTNREPNPDYAEMERISALHQAGRDEEIPGEGMAKITLMAKAQRILALRNGPDFLTVYVSAIGFGDVAFAGFAGEPFTDIGRDTKSRSPFAMTIPCCCTNGGQGYFPVRSAYDEGGYEASSSKYCPDVATLLTNAASDLLASIR